MLYAKFSAVLAGAAALGALTLGPMAPASADVITYDITASNLGVAVPPYVGPFDQVVVDLTSPTMANITFTSLTDASGYTYLFRSQSAVGVNVNATSWTVSNITASNSLGAPFTGPSASNGGSANLDGFGTFNQTIALFDGFMSSANEISFTLTDTSGTWASASQVLEAANPVAAEIGAYNASINFGDFTATGFSGNGVTTTTTTTTTSGIPEPGTMALLGSALLGLGFFRRRKSV